MRGRPAYLAPILVALVGSVCAQGAQAAEAGFSPTPSRAEPYLACGKPTPGHAECQAILVPSSPAAPLTGVRPETVGRAFSGSGVGGGYDPADLRSAYNLPSAGSGSGQTVAIVDAFDDPNAESDLAVYRAKYGVSKCTTANGCFKKVNQSGGTSYPKANAGWAVEISLDLDMVSAACPNCHLLLVEASSNADSNLYAAEDEAAALGATEISNSWGGEEFSGETSDDSFFAHPGVPITVSAGDSGYEVEYPAASPNVIAVGGTALSHASNSRGWTETAWSGTGSGCSEYEPKPAWQTDKGCADRTVNDVSAVASPATPVSVADSYELPSEFSKPEPGWTLVGGTSVSSPLLAGTMALANASTRSFTGADALYKEAAQNGTGVLDDVVTGSNGSCGTYLCNAGPGYDGPTGLGSPYGAPVVFNPPTVVTGAGSEVTAKSATGNATANPNGGEVSKCEFEYGTTTSYGQVAQCASLPGSGESPVAVSAALSGLTPNTTYHFRISATNAGGTSKGSDQTFKTLASCTAEGFCIAFTHNESRAAPFGEPTAVAVDPSGNIWVVDSAHDHVLQFNSSREFVRQIGSEGSGESQFKGIGGIATNSAGDLYVTDSGNDRVQEFSSTGGHLASFGSSAAGNGQLLSPGAIAVDASGNVWVLNGAGAQEGGRIVEFSGSGAFVSQFGSKGTAGGQLLYADGLAFSGGNLYVSEASPQRVQELSTSGEFIRQYDETGSLPSGIATDPSTGNLDVSDLNGHVAQFSAAGSLIASFGSPGSGNGQLWSPQAVAVGSSGTIYVADTHNQRVQEWKAGSPPTFANAFTHNESHEAPFGEPTAVAVDPSGNIWVADPAHDHVLQFNSSREFVRQIGSEGSGESQFKGIGGIATNSSGDIYVTDSGNDRVQEFSSTGGHLASFGSSAAGNGQLLSPGAIAVDASGNVWVLNGAGAQEGGRIVEFSGSGTFVSQFGSKGTAGGQLLYADGLAFSGGNLYVSEVSPQRVQELSTSGAFIAAFDETGSLPSGIATDPSTGNLDVSDLNGHVAQFSAAGSLIASFGSPGSGNGQLWSPQAVAVGSSGTIYVADTHNQRVEEWKLP